MPGYPEQPRKSLWQVANQSLIPEDAVTGLQNAIDNPTLDRTPWEARTQGFAAGALGGLADLVTPANIATVALPAGAGALAGRAAGAIGGRLGGQALQNPQALAKTLAAMRQTQRTPRAYEVVGLENQLKKRLTQIPTGSGPGGF